MIEKPITPTPEAALTEHPKVLEYTKRIEAGEDGEQITQGLPESIRQAVLQKTEAAKNNSEQDRLKRIAEIRKSLGVGEKKEAPELTDEEKADLEKEISGLSSEVYWKNRMSLNDKLWDVGHGILPDGEETFKTVSGEIGIHFNAHGIAKSQQLENLLTILKTGIDKSKPFYTAPFEIPNDLKAGGSGTGTAGGAAYKDGIAVLAGGYDESMTNNGIKHVFVNDVYSSLKEPLQKLFPQYNFHLLSEQKNVLENEFNLAQKSKI